MGTSGYTTRKLGGYSSFALDLTLWIEVIPAHTTALPRISDNITSLEYNDRVLIFPTVVQLSARLQLLTLTLPTTDATHPSTYFERLAALRVRLVFGSVAALPNGIMPTLRRLWLQNGDYTNHIHSLRDAEVPLDSCGGTLSFLWLLAFTFAHPPALAVLRLLCEVEPPLTHQRIHSLDICFPTRDTALDRTLTLPWEVNPPGLPWEDEAQSEFGDQDSRPELVWITAVLDTDLESDDADDYVLDVEADDDGIWMPPPTQ
ncbi:hypothetical protein FB451DRAFT_1392552 [Mycena latifolia]|nr:hypothetical protein FB451DRAFT_1392552 [Mycena latifolia]